MKKLVALVVVLGTCLCLLAACQKEEKKAEPMTPDDAIVIIAKDLNVDVSKIQGAHVHVAEGSVPAWNIYFSVDGQNYHYVVGALDGKIIEGTKVAQGHSH